MSLEELDQKVQIEFFPVDYQPDVKDIETLRANCFRCTSEGSHKEYFVIDNFLGEVECQQVLSALSFTEFKDITHLYDRAYRDSTRILAFDNNGAFTGLIEERLRQDYLLQRLRGAPYGFGTERAQWNVSGQINPCLRFNRYQAGSSGFNMHYDSQYTRSNYERSGWTLLIYLESPTEGGATQLGDTSVSPLLGRAVILPQHLLHAGNPVLAGRKTVLRTDILCHTTDTILLTAEERLLQERALLMFRQAQYYELEGNRAAASMFYESVLDLRINKDPKYLDMTLPLIEENIELIPDLTYQGRTGGSYTFLVNAPFTEAILKMAVLFGACTQIGQTIGKVPDWRRLVRDYLGMEPSVLGEVSCEDLREVRIPWGRAKSRRSRYEEHPITDRSSCCSENSLSTVDEGDQYNAENGQDMESAPDSDSDRSDRSDHGDSDREEKPDSDKEESEAEEDCGTFRPVTLVGGHLRVFNDEEPEWSAMNIPRVYGEGQLLRKRPEGFGISGSIEGYKINVCTCHCSLSSYDAVRSSSHFVPRKSRYLPKTDSMSFHIKGDMKRGTVTMHAPGSKLSFNHASCQCEADVVDGSPCKAYLPLVTYETSYTFDGTTLELLHTPKICL